MHVARLVAPKLDGEDHTKDIDFTPAGIRARWQAGYADTKRMIERAPWTAPVDPMDGVVIHDPAEPATRRRSTAAIGRRVAVARRGTRRRAKGGRMTERFDAIVIGTGQAGPALAVRLASAGPQDRDPRAQARRRHLRQRRLHSDQDADRERARRARRAPRPPTSASCIDGPVRVDMARVKARKDEIVAQSNRRRDELARAMRPTSPSSRVTAASRARTRSASTTGCSKRRRSSSTPAGARRVPAMAGLDRRAVSHQHRHDGHRFPARAPDRRSAAATSVSSSRRCTGASAAASPSSRWRRGSIAREDEDVSAAIQAILEGEGIAFRLNAECLAARAARTAASAST